MRAAQLHGEAGTQLLQRILGRHDLVVGGNSSREIGLQRRTGEPTRVTLDEFSRSQRLAENGHHARMRFQHRAHVHDLGERGDFRPGEELADLRCCEVGAGDFQSGRRRHARGSLHDEAQRQAAARLDRIAHAGNPQHVGKLGRVAEDRGGALRHHDRGIVVRQHVRGLEVHMPVDESGRNDAAADVMGDTGLGEAPARVNAGDHRADDADIGLAQLERGNVDDQAAGQKEIERLLSLRRGDGAQPRR